MTLAVSLGVGYLVHGASSSSPGRPVEKPAPTKELTASDLLLVAASATEGIHLRFPGITSGGSSSDHTNDIEVTSFQLGAARAISGGPVRDVSPASVSEITLTHQTDRFSLKLLNLALRGTSVPGSGAPLATLYFTDLSGIGGTPLDYLKIELQETLLSAFSISSGGTTPFESISLNFEVMTLTTHIPAGTTQVVTYNLGTGT